MDYASRLATLSLSEKDIAKLTPSRCTSMVVHPSEDTLVAVTGDVDGHIGVWQVRTSRRTDLRRSPRHGTKSDCQRPYR